jgi:hypothetical protein
LGSGKKALPFFIMGTIINLLRNFENLDTDAITEAAVNQTKGELQDKNKAQLMAGFDKTGAKIGDKKPYASSYYAFYKANLNPLPGLGNPDLHLTGDWQDEMSIEVSGESIIQNSANDKDAELIEKYGPEIYGLGGQFKEDYLEEDLRPAFNKGIELATGLKIGYG